MIKKTNLLLSASFSILLLNSAYAMESVELTNSNTQPQVISEQKLEQMSQEIFLEALINRSKRIFLDGEGLNIKDAGETLKDCSFQNCLEIINNPTYIPNYKHRKEALKNLIDNTRTPVGTKIKLYTLFKLVNPLDTQKNKGTIYTKVKDAIEKYITAVDKGDLKKASELAKELLVLHTNAVKNIIPNHEVTFAAESTSSTNLNIGAALVALSQLQQTDSTSIISKEVNTSPKPVNTTISTTRTEEIEAIANATAEESTSTIATTSTTLTAPTTIKSKSSSSSSSSSSEDIPTITTSTAGTTASTTTSTTVTAPTGSTTTTSTTTTSTTGTTPSKTTSTTVTTPSTTTGTTVTTSTTATTPSKTTSTTVTTPSTTTSKTVTAPTTTTSTAGTTTSTTSSTTTSTKQVLDFTDGVDLEDGAQKECCIQ